MMQQISRKEYLASQTENRLCTLLFEPSGVACFHVAHFLVYALLSLFLFDMGLQ